MSRRPKVWDDVPDVRVYKKNLYGFYRFMYERHSIWIRRFVDRQPPPWTDDLILRDYKFTNVYRELDQGTLWYMGHVFPDAVTNLVGATRELNLIWFTVMYRLLNRVETFESVGFVNYWQWKARRKQWKKALEDQHEKTPVFTSAHLTLPTHELGSSKIDKYMEVLDDLNYSKLRPIHAQLIRAKSLEEAFNILMDIKCVGQFISYEICCDLMMVRFLPFAENDWVNPGPGCKAGLRLIFPKTTSYEGFQDRIKQLQKEQRKHFRRLKLRFPYFHKGSTLTLRSIEHSLCEFSKYMKMQKKVGKQRMKFKPRDWPNAQGQLPFRFPREENS